MDINQIIVASQNPVKLQAVKNSFLLMFPESQFAWMNVEAPSGVNKQPFSDQETYLGALNRVTFIKEKYPNASYWVAIEGGIQFDPDHQMSAFAWVVIHNGANFGKARSGCFYLPSRVASLVQSGLELGEADDLVFGQVNSKQNNGAVGLLTGDVINRTTLYEQAVIMALIPFKNPHLYF